MEGAKLHAWPVVEVQELSVTQHANGRHGSQDEGIVLQSCGHGRVKSIEGSWYIVWQLLEAHSWVSIDPVMSDDMSEVLESLMKGAMAGTSHMHPNAPGGAPPGSEAEAAIEKRMNALHSEPHRHGLCASVGPGQVPLNISVGKLGALRAGEKRATSGPWRRCVFRACCGRESARTTCTAPCRRR